jgi:hypothetical protein
MTLDVYADLFDTDLDAVAVELDAVIKAAAAQTDRGAISRVAAGRLRAGTTVFDPPVKA